MDEDLDLDGTELHAHRCQEGHDGCYELYVAGGRYHFRPADVDALNERLMAALDAMPS